MDEQLTIYVTNWASVRADDRREAADKPRLYSGPRGRGRHYTIMASPRARYGEDGDGCGEALVPWLTDLAEIRARRITVAQYRERYVMMIDTGAIPPGCLSAIVGLSPHARLVEVADGSTLCCSCSRLKALAGCCHRAWAAELLRREGWRVVLDGRVLAGVTAEWVPVFEGPEGGGRTQGLLPGMED